MSDPTVKFGADIGAVRAAIEQLRGQIGSINSSLNSVTSTARSFATAFVGAFSAREIYQFIEATAKLGEIIEVTAAKLGVSTETVTRNRAAFQIAGLTGDAYSSSMERLARRIDAARRGNVDAIDDFRRAGVAYQTAAGGARSYDDILGDLADSFSRLENGQAKVSLAQNLLSRSGAQLIPVLNRGRAGLREFYEAAEKAGVVLSRGTVAAMAETDDKLDVLGLSFQGLGVRIFLALKPAVDTAIDWITRLIQSIDAARITSVMQTIAQVISDVIVILGRFALDFYSTIAGVFVRFAYLQEHGLKAFGGPLREKMNAELAAIEGTAEQRKANLERIVREYTAALKQLFADSQNPQAPPEDGGPRSAPPPPRNSGAIAARLQELETERQLARLGLQQQRDRLESEVGLHQITQGQKIGLLQRYTQDAYAAELALLQKEAELGGLSVQDKQKVLDRIKLLKAGHENEMLRLTQESVRAQQQKYEELFGAIAGAINAQVRGLLDGAISFKEAFKNIMADLITQFIQACITMAGKWAAAKAAEVATTVGAETTKTAATAAGVGARTAAEGAGATASIATTLATVFTKISAYLAEAFAGLTAALVPVFGPAAPAAALGIVGAAGVTAYGMIKSFDTGTPYVVKSGLANIHQGEAVLPPAEAQAWRAGQGNGQGMGGTVNFHLSAIDTRSGVEWLMQNKDAVRRALAGSLRNSNMPSAAWT